MMKTPCINICSLDRNDGLCDGCYRTIAEITGWSRYTAVERQKIMTELPHRSARRNAGTIQETANA